MYPLYCENFEFFFRILIPELIPSECFNIGAFYLDNIMFLILKVFQLMEINCLNYYVLNL